MDEYTDEFLTLKKAEDRTHIPANTILKAIHRATARGTLAPLREPGPKGRHIISLSNLRKLFPDEQRHAAGRKPMSNEEYAKHYPGMIRVGSVEWFASKERMRIRK